MDGITYAGNHGLEILHPDGTKFSHPMPPGYADFVLFLFFGIIEISQTLITVFQASCIKETCLFWDNVLVIYWIRY